MKAFIKDLLSSNTSVSSLRLMSFIALTVGCAIAIVGLSLNRDLMGLAALSSVFISAAFVGKVSQKFVEKDDK